MHASGSSGSSGSDSRSAVAAAHHPGPHAQRPHRTTPNVGWYHFVGIRQDMHSTADGRITGSAPVAALRSPSSMAFSAADALVP